MLQLHVRLLQSPMPVQSTAPLNPVKVLAQNGPPRKGDGGSSRRAVIVTVVPGW